MTPHGRAALVTGASSGIGRQVAFRLSQEGFAVALIDVDVMAGLEAAATARAAGGNALFVEADVRDEVAVEQAVQQVIDTFGRLDVVVNNAGATPRTALKDMSLGDWKGVLDLNLTSMFLVSRAAAPHLQASDAGAIVNVASLHAYATVPGLAAYAASKGGVVAFTRSLALELAPTVRVNAVAPGLIETETWRRSVPDVDEARRHRVAFHPLGRLGTEDDVAGAVAFLVGPDAAFVTGVTLSVDGGLSAQLYREA